MIRFVTAIMFYCFCFFSCKPGCKNDSPELYGKYVYKEKDEAIHYIEIKPNSVYLHYFSYNGKSANHVGQWSLSTDCRILFKDWKFLDSMLREPLCNCIDYEAFYKISSSSRIISFLVDDGVDFVKAKQE